MAIAELIRVDPSSAVEQPAFRWSTELEEHVEGISLVSPPPAIGGEFLAFPFSGACLYYLHSDAQVISRQRPSPRNRFAPMVVVPLLGDIVISQFGRESRTIPGQFALLDAAAPLQLTYGSEFRHLYLSLPPTSFVPATFHRAASTGDFGGSGFDQTLVSLTQSIWADADSLEADMHGSALNSILSLLPLTTPMRVPAMAAVPCIRVRRAMAYIEHHLSAEWLTPQAIADAQGVSRRYLDELFGKIDLRIERWIWERRLVRAYEEVGMSARARKGHGKSIIQIALDNGFKSPSHFSRAFSGRFGVCPREVRQGIQSGLKVLR